MTEREVLDEAYHRLHRDGPEFAGDERGDNGLTNHGPMAVEVMVRRGLDVDVDRWLDRYVPRLADALPAGTPIGDWRSALGQARRLPDWTRLFDDELAAEPWRLVLARWWPRLLPGIAAGATHGVIRVGHAVRTLRATVATTPAVQELAHGLAFWAARYRTVGGTSEPAGDRRPGDALEHVTRLAERSGPIARRLDRLQSTTAWTEDVRRLVATPGDDDVLDRLDELVAAAVGLYSGYGHGSPVLLVHCATAPNAVRHVLPELPVALRRPSLTAAWVAAAAVMATYAPPQPAPLASAQDLDADGVLDLAATHGDEHVLKFADTARDAWDRRADPGLLAAVVRAAELIDRPRP